MRVSPVALHQVLRLLQERFLPIPFRRFDFSKPGRSCPCATTSSFVDYGDDGNVHP